jgi:hypothetical protein
MPGQVSIKRRLNRSNCGVGALNQCSAGGHCGVELTIRAKALRRNFPDLKTVAHLLHQGGGGSLSIQPLTMSAIS